MREYSETDIALLNSGALRESIQPGPITLEEVFEVLPFNNDIIRVELTGKDLLNALTRSVSGTRQDEDGGFLQVSGIRVTVRGQRVESVHVGEQETPLDPGRIYTVALPGFLFSGGDGYALFVGKPGVNTRLPLREVVVDAIRNRKSISAHLEKRIIRMDTP
jgi:2',3'-cyclic-nucleotide 2'-phosphodiesterase (5'-nucleotidase family)